MFGKSEIYETDSSDDYSASCSKLIQLNTLLWVEKKKKKNRDRREIWSKLRTSHQKIST